MKQLELNFELPEVEARPETQQRAKPQEDAAQSHKPPLPSRTQHLPGWQDSKHPTKALRGRIHLTLGTTRSHRIRASTPALARLLLDCRRALSLGSQRNRGLSVYIPILVIGPLCRFIRMTTQSAVREILTSLPPASRSHQIWRISFATPWSPLQLQVAEFRSSIRSISPTAPGTRAEWRYFV